MARPMARLAAPSFLLTTASTRGRVLARVVVPLSRGPPYGAPTPGPLPSAASFFPLSSLLGGRALALGREGGRQALGMGGARGMGGVGVGGGSEGGAGARGFRSGVVGRAGVEEALAAWLGEQEMDRVWMKEQEVLCVIGCNEDERVRPQPLIVSVGVWTDLRASLEACGVPDFNRLEAQIERADRQDWAEMAAQELTATTNFATLAKISRKVCTEGKWFTIEALAEAIAREVVEKCGVAKVSVLIDKPDALRKQGVRAAAVQIIRSRKDFQ